MGEASESLFVAAPLGCYTYVHQNNEARIADIIDTVRTVGITGRRTQ